LRNECDEYFDHFWLLLSSSVLYSLCHARCGGHFGTFDLIDPVCDQCGDDFTCHSRKAPSESYLTLSTVHRSLGKKTNTRYWCSSHGFLAFLGGWFDGPLWSGWCHLEHYNLGVWFM